MIQLVNKNLNNMIITKMTLLDWISSDLSFKMIFIPAFGCKLLDLPQKNKFKENKNL